MLLCVIPQLVEQGGLPCPVGANQRRVAGLQVQHIAGVDAKDIINLESHWSPPW